jgi:oligopeptide/dipeptide ABC transporter ATP-binding protein
MSAAPTLDVSGETRDEEIQLRGEIPSPFDIPSGCRFRTRCWKAREVCATEEPALVPREGGRQLTACHFPEKGELQ